MKLLEHLEGFISGKFHVAKTLLSLIKLEARLAGLSVFPLLLNLCLLFIVLMSVWFTTMLMLGYCFMLWIESPLAALFMVLALNLILLLMLIKYLTFNLKNMSFEKTRGYFSKKELDLEPLKNDAAGSMQTAKNAMVEPHFNDGDPK
ncbi:MAG: hypothetical protein PSV35_08995 [bacterium]|nr:hypothetical protein [bacterium]